MLELDYYQKSLAGLLLVCGTLLVTGSPSTESKTKGPGTADSKKRQYEAPNRGSQWAFYVVYGLVMASDWLQNQHLYPLYREQNVPEHHIPTLETATLLTAALSAPLVGILADLSGRRFACLITCLLCSLSCVLTTIPHIPSLFVGRILGGVSSGVLFSAFESWMVADFRARHLESKGFDLGRTFGIMGAVNGVVAVGSRVVGEWAVERMGTRAVFGVCAALPGLSAFFINTQWDENYSEASKRNTPKPEANLLKTLTNRHLLALTFASTIFEGSTHLFFSSWVPALEAAQEGAASIPHNTIFAALMASAVASSLFFTKVRVASEGLLWALLGASGATLYAITRAPSEQATFWLLCTFGACTGAYGPCMGILRGRMVGDAVRARVYGFMRIPVNIFVVVSLMMGSGEGEYVNMFSTCAGLLHFTILGLSAAGTGGEVA